MRLILIQFLISKITEEEYASGLYHLKLGNNNMTEFIIHPVKKINESMPWNIRISIMACYEEMTTMAPQSTVTAPSKYLFLLINYFI